MERKKIRLRLSISLVFTGSLIGMFAIFLVLIAVLYSQFQDSLLASLAKQTEEFASQVSSTSKFADEILIGTTNQIFYDPAVLLLRESKEISNFEFINGIRRINAITASIILIDSIYIYNGKQDYIYSTAQYGAVNADAEHFKDRSAELLLRDRPIDQRLVMIPRKTQLYSRSVESHIYSFLFFETNPDGTPADNAIMLNLKASAFTRLYFGSDIKNQAFIMNGEGELIAAQDALDEGTRQMLISKIAQEFEQGMYSDYFRFSSDEGKEMLCFYSSISNHNWIYVKTHTYEEAFSDLLHTRNRTLVTFSLVILILVAVWLLIRKRIYVPYRKITQKISRALSGNGNENPKQIIQNLDQLIVEHDTHEIIEPKIKSELLKDLLQARKNVNAPDFNIESCRFGIALELPVILYLVYLKTCVLELEPIQQKIPYCEAVGIEAYTILFLQPMSQDQELMVRSEFVEKCQDIFLIYTEEIKDWSLIPLKYQGLRETFQLRFLHPESTLLALEAQPERMHAMVLLSEKSAAVVGFLRKGLYLKTVETWNEFVHELDGKQYSTVNVALINIANVILKLASDYSLLDMTYEEACTVYQTTINNLEEIQELNRLFDVLFRKITDCIQLIQLTSKKNTIDDICQYLMEHYTDPQLSTKAVADAFNMSPAYLSRIFRQNRRHSLMDEVNVLRIQEAKRCLENTDFLIKDIPHMIGLENPQYFFHLFKKLTGKTPKAFQNDLRFLKKREAAKLGKRI